MKLFFSGRLSGIDKEEALQWARETPSMKKLPEHVRKMKDKIFGKKRK